MNSHALEKKHLSGHTKIPDLLHHYHDRSTNCWRAIPLSAYGRGGDNSVDISRVCSNCSSTCHFPIKMIMEMTNNFPLVTCPCCNGDGKETCHNPDHGFIGIMQWHEIGRLGCPGCGHDPYHKVPNGGNCELCEGTGEVSPEVANDWLGDEF